VEIMAEMWDSEEVIGLGRRRRKEKRSRGAMETERRREVREMVWSTGMVERRPEKREKRRRKHGVACKNQRPGKTFLFVYLVEFSMKVKYYIGF
jgi:hypothetical protein